MTVEALSSTADLEDSREKLIHSFAALPEELLDDPDVIGKWSIRQALTHIMAWDRWAEEAFAALERGETVAVPGEHEMNTAAVEAMSAESVDSVIKRLRESRLQLIGRLSAMTDDERADKRYTLNSKQLSADDFIDGYIEHDLEHASEIRAWRKAKGL